MSVFRRPADFELMRVAYDRGYIDANHLDGRGELSPFGEALARYISDHQLCEKLPFKRPLGQKIIDGPVSWREIALASASTSRLNYFLISTRYEICTFGQWADHELKDQIESELIGHPSNRDKLADEFDLTTFDRDYGSYGEKVVLGTLAGEAEPTLESYRR